VINVAEARSRVRAAGGDELCERLEHLDAIRRERLRSSTQHNNGSRIALQAPDRGVRTDFDVVIAGGGLSLLLAPLLADRGLSVAVFDRATVGAAHREWNAGTAELRALAASGLFTPAEIDALIVARYACGVCRWHGGGAYPVTGVLDHAFDAGRLLAEARARSARRGVAILDGHTLLGHAEGSSAVTLAFSASCGASASGSSELSSAGRVEIIARLLVDARGASSPHATADLLCPTVGGVISGLEEGEGDDRVQPDVGEILATTEGVENGVQHIWEAFPGRPGEVTVYLFYYARAEEVRGGALLDLYARFFERLPAYKRGQARLVRPTFGYIPGWSRLGRAPSSPGPRVALVGDAAARHSPLTFCGFGATVRSLNATADAIAGQVARRDALPRGGVVSDAPIHAGTGALAMLMATPPTAPARKGELNDLLDVAFRVLHGMGNDAYAALLRDEMSPADFIRFLRATAALRPRVYRDVLMRIGPAEIGRWGLGIARELWRTPR
jgi:lycopene cyclase CruA